MCGQSAGLKNQRFVGSIPTSGTMCRIISVGQNTTLPRLRRQFESGILLHLVRQGHGSTSRVEVVVAAATTYTRLVKRTSRMATDHKLGVRVFYCVPFARLAQLGEHHPYKLGVGSSRLSSRTTLHSQFHQLTIADMRQERRWLWRYHMHLQLSWQSN